MGKSLSDWERWRRRSLAGCGLLAAVLLLGCASGASAPTAEPNAGTEADAATAVGAKSVPATVTAVDVREAAPGARLEVVASEPLVWTQYRDSEGRLVLELPNALPAEGVGDLEPAAGIVAAVQVEQLGSSERPLTRLVITTRQPAEHELTTEGSRLVLALVPVGEA
ncbi:MAG TPA: AMIN domain-containing protein, partial [Thermoanaerobaculia bacterium]|nr:AMIN domain-containing protein [Thermoanaerobaculia bacterium]